MENIYFNKKLLNKYTKAENIDFPKLHLFKKTSYRINIKVRWCIDSRLQKIFWKFIQYTHWQTPAHFCRLPHTPMHTCAYPTHPHTQAHTHSHLHTPMYMYAQPHPPTYMYIYLHTPVHTYAHLCTHVHTSAHPHTPANTTHIPADALNLINHMKLQ